MRIGTSKMARQDAISSSLAFNQQWQVAGKASLPASENNIYLPVPEPKIIVDRTVVSSAGPHGAAAQQRMGAKASGLVGITLRVVTLVVHGSAVHGGMAGAGADEASTSKSAFDGNNGQCDRTLLAAAASASTADPALLRAYCRHLREILLQSDASIGGDSSALLDTLEVALALRRFGTDSAAPAAEGDAPAEPAPAAAPVHLPIQGMRTAVNGGSCMHASYLPTHWQAL